MSQIIEILEYLKKYPVFTNIVVQNKLDKNSAYTKLFLHRLAKRGLIYRIEKNKYTVFNDPFLVASRIAWPSYISCWSSLKYHNLTEQIPHNIYVIATKNRKQIRFNNTQIIFIKINSKNFFGYEKIKYGNFEIFIADKEKSIIDSALLKKVSFSELQEIISNHIKDINAKKFLHYLKKIGNRSLIKRLGYMFEKVGKNYYNKLKKDIDATYIILDYSKKIKINKGIIKRNNKWRVITNA